jgi:pyrroloquinoline quinone biosynthesis protein E
VNLSGGETMVYPHLYELLEECSSLGMYAAVALSGYGVDKRSLRKLIDSGASDIYISLNGSTEEISRHTRDGHDLAMGALGLLAEMGFENTAVNWVAHRSNIEDFANVASLCAELKVKRLVVIAFKPDASNRMESVPGEGEFIELVQCIRRLRDISGLRIEVESCYSPLRALLGQRFLLNYNIGMSKGCGAGRDGASLNVDGNFTPCRHLDFPESFDTLKDYWHNSKLLQKLRIVESDPEEPCKGCRYESNCLSCLAMNVKLQGRIAKTNQFCGLWR